MIFKIRKYQRLIIYLSIFIRFFLEYISIIKVLFRTPGSTIPKIRKFITLVSLNRFFKLFKIYFFTSRLDFEFDEINRNEIIYNIKKALDLIEYPKFISNQIIQDIHYLEIKGWIDFKYHAPNLNNLNYISTRLKRRDVSRTNNRKNLYSGFRVSTKSHELFMENAEIYLKSDPSVKTWLKPATHALEEYFELVSVSRSADESIGGFIDEVKIRVGMSNDLIHLDYFFFLNMFSCLNLDRPLKCIDHKVLETIYKSIAILDPKILDFLYVNTSIADKIQGSLPPFVNAKFFEYRIQKETLPHLITLRNGRLLKGKFIIDNEGALVNEFSDSLGSDLVAGVNNELFFDIENRKKTGIFLYHKEIIELEKGIVLPSLVNSNWFHFITESLAVLVWFEDKIPKDWPIIVTHGVPNNVISLLKFLDYKNVLFINSNTQIKFDNLITFSKSAVIKDSLLSDINSFQLNPAILLNLRSKILQRLELNNAVNKLPESLMFIRGHESRRNLKLSKQQLKIVQKKDFEKIDIEKYSFEDQLKIFRKIDNLIMVGGASMANLMFMKPSIQISYITSELLTDYRLPEDFSSVFGLKIKLLGGKVKPQVFFGARNYFDIFHGSYFLSTRQLKKILTMFNKVT